MSTVVNFRSDVIRMSKIYNFICLFVCYFVCLSYYASVWVLFVILIDHSFVFSCQITKYCKKSSPNNLFDFVQLTYCPIISVFGFVNTNKDVKLLKPQDMYFSCTYSRRHSHQLHDCRPAAVCRVHTEPAKAQWPLIFCKYA